MLRDLRRVKGKEGFTLIELLIAITILVVIIAIMVGLFAGNQGSIAAKAKKIIDRGRQLSQAVQEYYSKNGKMPTDLTVLVSDGELNSVPNDWSFVPATATTPFTLFDNSTKADDVVSYSGSIGNEVCKKIVEDSDYVYVDPSGNLMGMFMLYDSTAAAAVTDPANCTDSDVFYYLVRADVQ